MMVLAYSNNNQQKQQGILVDPTMEYGEKYADYGGYDEYDNSGIGNGQAANKDLDDLISQSMSLILNEAGSRVWKCDLCNKTIQIQRVHKKTHLQFQNQCPHCDKQLQTRKELMKHIYRYHKH